MMYLVSTFAAGAAAIELRNLSVDAAKNTIVFNGHGYANNDIVLASANIGSTSTANLMYVVASATTNDFKLKIFTAATAAGGAEVAFADATGGDVTLSKYGAKKCKVASTASATDKVTCAEDPKFALTDELRIYCTNPVGAACKLDTTANPKLANGDKVWAREVATAFTLSDAKPTDATTANVSKIVIAADAAGASLNSIWLLTKDTGSIYAAAPKTLIADGGKWDTSTTHGGSATAAMAVCGNAACGVSDGKPYFYMAGSAATAGLTDKNVYYIDGGAMSPTANWKFQLKKADATAASLSVGAAQAVTGSGNGDTYQRIEENGVERLTGSEKAGNNIVFHANKSAVYEKDTAVIFWCSDATTAADCDYKVTGMTNGAQFKIKSVAGVKAVLKATTGKADCTALECPDVAVTANSASSTMTKGYLLKKHTETATVFPAAAAGSAARSFAMLGSAVAMATAFLLA